MHQQLIAFIVCCSLWISVYSGYASHDDGYSSNYAGHLSEVLQAQESHTHESLGYLGDHLSEEHFPADIESDHYAASASEYHPEIESLSKVDHFGNYNDVELGHHFGGGDESYHGELEKPVTGIDHGKGAFSYSTLYESKEEK